MWKASKTRRNVLNLNRRMRLFIDTYLLQVATETARLNLRALAEPPPPLPRISASSEKVMWKVMSWSNGATTGDRTSTKALPVVSDPNNPLLAHRYSQNIGRSITPAAVETNTGRASTSTVYNSRVSSTSTPVQATSNLEPPVSVLSAVMPYGSILRFRRSRPTCISDYQFVITPTTNPHIIEAARV
ncbi:hypothetical protein BD410DRAFT_361123 [Rickenella mellea]|uniref:Uncharacterized protein n=1 Tax=Rickenella mellea TaxID=50990 RepID=A0A4Y7PGY2_9AGAM|nr:hypothetical protein BD410DRAFT_361123 [Rickenella mellea]